MFHAGTSLTRGARDDLFLLCVLLVLCVQMARALPTWAGVLATTTLVWRIWIAVTGRPLPGPWLLGSLLAAVVAGVVAELVVSGSVAGAALTLLLLLLALKTLESRNRRDTSVLFFLGFFSLVTTFLFAQTIDVAALMLLVFWGLLTAQVNNQLPVGRPRLWQAGRTAACLGLIGLPLILALYLFFPRFPPLWGMPNTSGQGMTGLSESMEVGNIADLAQSREIALRLRFEPGSPIPLQSQMYFRGPVLSRFEGRNWTAPGAPPLYAGAPPGSVANPVVAGGTAVRYESIIEPHRQRWLLPLEVAAPAQQALSVPDGLLDQELLWRSANPLNAARRYSTSAYLEAAVAPQASPQALARYLQLPAAGNMRTRAWAAELRRELSGQGLPGQADRRLAEHVLGVLHQSDYHYTLQPPIYSEDTADDFWFVHRSGFCEHIASAYAVLMRAAGIPARVVTGYQGGEANMYDGVWTVRQSDAHAWVELWFEGEGWVRIDPTAAIAPNRIALPQSQALQQGDDVRRGSYNGALRWMAHYEAMRDAIDYRWVQWVLNYDQRNQVSLLQRLGLGGLGWLSLALLPVGLCLGGALLYLGWPLLRRQRASAWKRLLEQARVRLAAGGLELPAHTPPRRMAEQVHGLFGDEASDVSQWLLAMDAFRYGSNPRYSIREMAARSRRLNWPEASRRA